MIILAIPALLIILVLATRDLTHAAEPEYQSAIGYDTKAGWIVMALLIGAALAAAGALGCGPLAMLAK